MFSTATFLYILLTLKPSTQYKIQSTIVNKKILVGLHVHKGLSKREAQTGRQIDNFLIRLMLFIIT